MITRGPHSGFTLIELLVVVAVIAVLSVVVILSLNPAELLRQSRDTNRLSDMDTLNHALSMYSVDQSGMTGFFMGTSSVVYVSLPDSSSTCGNLNLPTLPTGYAYNCVASTSLKNTNGTGWIPVPLANVSGGSPVGNLPVDPLNQSSTRLYYTYTTNGAQFELTTSLESKKYDIGGSSDVVATDGGALATVYEKGSKLGLEPLDYGDPSLVGLWTFDEGSGATAYDYGGKNLSAPWSGGSSYVAGKVGAYAGSFNLANYVGEGTQVGSGVSQLTLSAWVNPNTSSSIAGTVLFQNHGGSNYLYKLELANDYPQFEYFTTSAATLTGPSLVPTGAWTLLTCVYDGVKQYIYVNGAVSTSTAAPYPGSLATDPASGIQIGKNAYQGNFYGLIDDVRIYNRALSATEVAAMYSGGK